MKQEKTKVVTLQYVSQAKVVPSITNRQTLVEVNSTKENMMVVESAVSVGQPVLLGREVGVGKTSLVMEWGARTGREVLSLQVSDNTDARLLVGLYRCTDLPGQFVWEEGLIKDIDRAPWWPSLPLSCRRTSSPSPVLGGRSGLLLGSNYFSHRGSP